jgi:hypothetical protein
MDDKCPHKPEDKDSFEDVDGCPDPDNDQGGQEVQTPTPRVDRS